MVYLLETELVDNKSLYFSLKNIYGIGKNKSFFICKKLGFSINFKIKDLTNEQINTLVNFVETSNYIINNDLKKKRTLFINNLIIIKSYRGLRKLQGLPVRGQRTRTNYKTARKKIF